MRGCRGLPPAGVIPHVSQIITGELLDVRVGEYDIGAFVAVVTQELLFEHCGPLCKAVKGVAVAIDGVFVAVLGQDGPRGMFYPALALARPDSARLHSKQRDLIRLAE